VGSSSKAPWLDLSRHIVDVVGHINVTGAALLLAIEALAIAALALCTLLLALKAVLVLLRKPGGR